MNRKMTLGVIAGTTLALAGAALAGTPDHERAYAAELMADAASRTSELAQNSRFTVDVHGYTQFRYNWNQRRSDPDGFREEDSTMGFQMARTRLSVSGNIVNDDWAYLVQFGVQPDGSFILDDAYGTFRFSEGWHAQFGQFKLPFARETIVGDQYQLAAERSVTESIFGLDRSQGIQLGFIGDAMRVSGAFSDGAAARNSDFNALEGGQDGGFVADFALTGRLDWKWAGEWNQAQDFTSFPNSDYFGMFGVAGHYQRGGDTFAEGLGTTLDHEAWALTADLSMEGNGWNVFAAGYMHSYTLRDQLFFDGTYRDWGLVVQGGVFVTPRNELFARWDSIFPDSDWEQFESGEDFHTLTLGLNHYFVPSSHAAKLTVDFQWFFEAPNDSIVPDNTLLGLLEDSRDNQWNLRAQVQLLF